MMDKTYSPLGFASEAAGTVLDTFRSQTESVLRSVGSVSERTAFARSSGTSKAGEHDIQVLSSIAEMEPEKWNAIVDRSRNGTIFHRYEWLDAVETALDHEPVHLVVRKKGNPIGLFPHFALDIPKTPFRRLSSARPEFGGPLIPTDAQDVLPLVLEEARRHCGGRRIVHEIRAHELNQHRFADPLWFRGYRPYVERSRHLLDLRQGQDQVLSGLHDNRRRAFRRGQEADYEVVDEKLTNENLQRFHRTYEAVMERVGGEILPLEFFEHLRSMKDDVIFRSIYIEGEYAGGVFDLADRKQSMVYGFKLAVPQEYFSKNATELLAYGTIARAIEDGFETYDLGTTRPNHEDPLFRHKVSFGSDIVPVVTWERGTSVLWPMARFARHRYLSNNHQG